MQQRKRTARKQTWVDKLKAWERGHDEEYARRFLGPPEAVTIDQAIPPNGVVIIMGDIRSGKTGLAFQMMDRCHQKRGVGACLYLPNGQAAATKRVTRMLPEWCGVVREQSRLPHNSVIVWDEAAQAAHARRSQSEAAVEMEKMLGVAGQRNQLILVISHHSTKLDINMIRASRLILWKRPTYAHALFEREEFQRYTRRAIEVFAEAKGKEKLRLTYMMDLHNLRFATFKNGLTEWWTEELSTLFKDL